jgi:hypothetical protein
LPSGPGQVHILPLRPVAEGMRDLKDFEIQRQPAT